MDISGCWITGLRLTWCCTKIQATKMRKRACSERCKSFILFYQNMNTRSGYSSEGTTFERRHYFICLTKEDLRECCINDILAWACSSITFSFTFCYIMESRRIFAKHGISECSGPCPLSGNLYNNATRLFAGKSFRSAR